MVVVIKSWIMPYKYIPTAGNLLVCVFWVLDLTLLVNSQTKYGRLHRLSSLPLLYEVLRTKQVL